MKKIIVLLLCLPTLLAAQVSSQPEYINFLKAKVIFDRAIQFSGLQSDSLTIGISATGVMHESGHFSTPDERVDMPETYTLRLFNGINNFYMDGLINYQGRELSRQVYVKEDSIFYRDHFDRGVSRDNLSHRIELYNEILTLHPVLILNSARKALTSLRYLGKAGIADLVSFSTNQATFTLRILPDGQLAEASYLATHAYYGDNVHRYEYLDYKPVGIYQLPNRFKEYEFGALRKEQSFMYDLKPKAVLPTNQVCPSCALVAKITVAGQVTIKSLGDSLYVAELNTYNNRVLFLVGVKDVTVFEAPIGYKASQQVIDAIKQKTGGKPITKIVVTHHAGGLRAFVEQGALVVTTKENVAFFNRFVNYTHELEGRKESKPLKPTYLVVDSVRTFNQAGSESFSVYFIDDTQHTKEHLVTYFPKQKVLFHGDLCFFRLTGESAASVREQAVGKLINRYKLNVEKIYGSWPVKGFKEFGTKEDLNRKLELARK
jgi:glyoxylase-like metal-dependent hydrolase (beta-lactamase superfamily II)